MNIFVGILSQFILGRCPGAWPSQGKIPLWAMGLEAHPLWIQEMVPMTTLAIDVYSQVKGGDPQVFPLVQQQGYSVAQASHWGNRLSAVAGAV